MKPGQGNAITDVPGLRVGNAQDDNLKSGVTVLVGDEPFVASVSVMGGAPGTRETDLLRPDKMVDAVDALVLSGGSAFGLDAAAGVIDALASDGRGFAVGEARVPIVPAAILFDLLNGGDKSWAVNPYRKLGTDAYRAAGTGFALGTAGAGTGATTCDLKGGLGSASIVLPSGITVGALVAANALGSVTVGGEANFWAAPFEAEGEFGGLGPAAATYVQDSTFRTKISATEEGANTTIAIVATDAELSKAEAHRMAVAAHDGMARAIVPSHTPFDGDLVFSVSTRRRPPSGGRHDLLAIGHAAAVCLARAIARAVFEATPAPGDRFPAWREKFRGRAGP